MSELPPDEPSIAGADAGGRKTVAHEARGAPEPGHSGRGEDRELIEAWRAVANAKLVEFRQQSWRLAVLASRGVVGEIAAVDRLWEIAIAHALVRALGEDRVQAIISEAFAATHQEAGMIEQTGGPSTHPEIGVDKLNGGGDDQHGQGQSAPNFNQQENVFPSIDSAAYHGLVGEIVRTIAPHFEADRWSDPSWGDAARQYHAARGGRLLVVERQPDRLARFRQLLGDNTSLDRVWRELNECGDRPAPQTTFDALLYELRTLGVAAFKNPSCRRRLADLSDSQLRELLAALIRTRARYPGIPDELLIALDEIRR